MSPLARIGFSSSASAYLRAAVVVLAWLALWFSALIATLERPQPLETESRVRVEVASRG
jgi:hypothetical protein